MRALHAAGAAVEVPRGLLLTTYYLLLTAHCLLRTTYNSLLATHYLLLPISTFFPYFTYLSDSQGAPTTTSSSFLRLTSHFLLSASYLLLSTCYFSGSRGARAHLPSPSITLHQPLSPSIPFHYLPSTSQAAKALGLTPIATEMFVQWLELKRKIHEEVRSRSESSKKSIK